MLFLLGCLSPPARIPAPWPFLWQVKQILMCIHGVLGSPSSTPSGCPGLNSSQPRSPPASSALPELLGKPPGISAGLCEAQRHPGWALRGTGRNSASSCFFLLGWKSAGKLLVLRLSRFLLSPGRTGLGLNGNYGIWVPWVWALCLASASLSFPTGMLPPGASNPTAWPRSKAALSLKLGSQSLRTLVFPA